MDRIEWAQRVAESRIHQQLAIADGLDAKGGILFAYCGAVIAASGTIGHEGVELAMALAIITAAVAGVATIFILWPQTVWDSPDAEKLAAALSQDHAKADILATLLNQQLDDGAVNKMVLTRKVWALRVAIIGAALATALLLAEIAQGRGV